MSLSPDQLTRIYQNLQTRFASHPVISILPSKGDPPDQYEVTYSMTGLRKEESGTVAQTSTHSVEISIPFGFPHFPPSCKPKSEIFHPDFDPAAICLGDFWHQDRSLGDLVIHIGRMINGEMYSTQNAFNEEAAEYYTAHSDSFPIAQLIWGEEDVEFVAGSTRVDTLGEEDLLPDFNFFALEKSDSASDTPDNAFDGPDAHIAKVRDRLFLLESQKKFYQLLEVASESNLPADELEPIIRNGRFQVAKAEELYSAAQLKETQGAGEESLHLYAEVGNIVSDFPAIHSDIQRVADNFLMGKKSNKDKGAEEQPDRANVPDKDDHLQQNTVQEGSRDSFFTESKKKSRVPLYIAFLSLALAAGLASFFYISSLQNLSQAEQAFIQCSSSLEDHRFTEAKSLCEQALRAADRVKFLDKEKVWQIQAGAGELLKSERLIQGLAGKTYIDGRYLPNKDATLLKSLKNDLLEADALYQAEKWQNAAELFGTIEIQAKKSGLFDEPTLEEISSKRLTAEFKVSFDSAMVAMALVAMQKGQWEVAVAELIKAQEILTNIPEPERAKYSEQLQYALAQCRFEDLKGQGDSFYSKGEWKNALTSYNFALSNAENDSLLPSNTIAHVRQSITRSELYVAIDEGNQFFGARQWDEAIRAYDRAIQLLNNHPDVFDPTDSRQHSEKLGRIVLQASIIRDRQIAKQQRKEKNLQEQRDRYKQILANIEHSQFAGEKEFATTRKEISASLKVVEEEIYVAGLEDYLIENYQQFFNANYPTATPENLTNPTVSFIRQTPEALVYKMQCTEIGQGRPLTLVMYYAYNKKRKSWSLVDEKN